MDATRRLSHVTMVAATLAATFLAQAGEEGNAVQGVAALATAVIAGRPPESVEPPQTFRWPNPAVGNHRSHEGAALPAEASALTAPPRSDVQIHVRMAGR